MSRRSDRGPGGARRLSRAELQGQLRGARSDIERQVQATRAQIDEANARIEARAGRNLVLAVGGVLIVTAAYLADPGVRWVVVLAVGAGVVAWRLVGGAFRREAARPALRDAAASLLVLGYVPLLASFAMVLLAEDGGEWWVLAFIIIVISVDTGAYAAGVTAGRHPMAPRISPKKTWEGFAGAALAAMIAGALLAWLLLDMPVWLGLVFGAVLLLSATMGDLGESLIKRDLGIKDMSSWLPGHGGLLDRLDSLLPSAPFALGVFLLGAQL